MSKFIQKPSKIALDWLQADPQSGSLMAQVERLASLQEHVNLWAKPRHLHLSVANYHQRSMRVLVSHPAILSRLRQQIPSLILHLQTYHWQIIAIESKVQAKQSPVVTTKYPKVAQIGPTGRQAWADLASTLTDENLRRSALKLCKHHNIDAT